MTCHWNLQVSHRARRRAKSSTSKTTTRSQQVSRRGHLADQQADLADRRRHRRRRPAGQDDLPADLAGHPADLAGQDNPLADPVGQEDLPEAKEADHHRGRWMRESKPTRRKAAGENSTLVEHCGYYTHATRSWCEGR